MLSCSSFSLSQQTPHEMTQQKFPARNHQSLTSIISEPTTLMHLLISFYASTKPSKCPISREDEREEVILGLSRLAPPFPSLLFFGALIFVLPRFECLALHLISVLPLPLNPEKNSISGGGAVCASTYLTLSSRFPFFSFSSLPGRFVFLFLHYPALRIWRCDLHSSVEPLPPKSTRPFGSLWSINREEPSLLLLPLSSTQL